MHVKPAGHVLCLFTLIPGPEFDTGISVVRLMREQESQSLPLPCTRHSFSPALGDLWVSGG